MGRPKKLSFPNVQEKTETSEHISGGLAKSLKAHLAQIQNNLLEMADNSEKAAMLHHTIQAWREIKASE